MTDTNLDYKKAKTLLLSGMNSECQCYFAKNNYPLELSYCQLLNDNIADAEHTLSFIKNSDIRAHWLDFLISLIKLDANGYPSYFEIRNFLEIDLNILLRHYKGNYTENILRYSDSLFTINPEVYKFIGRVLYNNGYEPQAMFFLDKAKQYFYNDPELHYLLGFIFYNKKEYLSAQKALKNCLNILPKYFPAMNLNEKIIKTYK